MAGSGILALLFYNMSFCGEILVKRKQTQRDGHTARTFYYAAYSGSIGRKNRTKWKMTNSTVNDNPLTCNVCTQLCDRNFHILRQQLWSGCLYTELVGCPPAGRQTGAVQQSIPHRRRGTNTVSLYWLSADWFVPRRPTINDVSAKRLGQSLESESQCHR